MQDLPEPFEILNSVATFLRDTVIREASAHTAYQARVAANALELVARQIALAPAAELTEMRRLEDIMGEAGTLESLNAELATALAEGRIGPETPGVVGHLWATTMEKLAVDQPGYSGYRAALNDMPPCSTGEI